MKEVRSSEDLSSLQGNCTTASIALEIQFWHQVSSLYSIKYTKTMLEIKNQRGKSISICKTGLKPFGL